MALALHLAPWPLPCNAGAWQASSTACQLPAVLASMHVSHWVLLLLPPVPMCLCRRRAAPEIISNLHIEDATKIDIWSAGVMLYVMLFCCYPFERPDDNANQGDQQKYQKARTQSTGGLGG